MVIELTSKKFGRLTVIERAENSKWGKTRWVCKCNCGKVKTVLGEHLRKGRIVSCGCYNKEKKSNLIHGERHSRIYSIWCDMKYRCSDSNSAKRRKNYYDRGIRVCSEWKDSFETFKKWSMSHGYTDKLTIDRIDVDGNYEPFNCRWVDIKTQDNNKTTNHYVTYKGEKITVAELSEKVGLTYNTLLGRILRNPNKPIEELLERPKTHAERMATDKEYHDKMIKIYKSNRPNAIAVNMIDKDSKEVIKDFPKLMDAAEWIKNNTKYKKADYSTINKVCKGRGKTAYGYSWEYKGGDK
ncbi:hypothetical protein FDF26_11310 [Clostridium botulinum]|nr:hypothetical protein [Clostridium botulinum]